MLPKNQPEKLETLASIRRKIDRHRDMMTADEQQEAQKWRPPDDLHALTVDDLPKVVREAFTETDGQRGRLIGIDVDHSTYYDWNGHDLLRMSPAVTVDALGKHWVAMAPATVFAGMLETIIADGPKVTLWALIGVVTLVLLAFGLRGAPPVLIALGIGVVWMGGIVGTIGLKLNFMNFVALPITLGVGTEYAANIWARLHAEGPSRRAHGHRRDRQRGGALLADDDHRLQLAAVVAQSRAALVRPARRHRRSGLPGRGAGGAAGAGARVLEVEGRARIGTTR